MGKWCLQASLFIFDPMVVKLAGNQDSHKISNKFEFRPDHMSHFRVICPWEQIKFSIDILWNLEVQLTFQTLEFFVTLFSGTMRPRRLKLGYHLDSGQMYHVYQNQAAALIQSFISSFFFISNFQHWNFSSHFSQELPGLEDWNLVHTWTVGRGIMYTGIRLLFHPFYFFIFLSLQFSTLKFFITFLRNCEA